MLKTKVDRKNRTPSPYSEYEYVYLFRRSDLYKIGRTGHIGSRKANIASTYQSPIDVVHSVYVRRPELVEMEWAWRFRHQRSRAEQLSRKIGATEWYNLSDQDVAWICSQQADEVLNVECTITIGEAIECLQQHSANIKFLPSSCVRIHLPIWSGYYVERATFLEAATVVKERILSDC